MNGVCNNLCPQFVHNCHGFEKSKEVFSNLVMLSKKLKLDLKEDDFTELLSVQHKELNTEDLGIGGPEKGRRETEKEVIKEPKTLTMWKMTKGFSLFQEALLVF